MRGRWVLFLCCIALPACQQRPVSESSRAAATPGPVTYNKDIAPILFQNCATCHRPVNGNPNGSNASNASNGSNDPLCIAGAPFSLLEYRTAREHAGEIVMMTRKRAMPPWLPEPGHGRFINTRRLGDDQIALIQRWVEQGAPEGDPADKPRAPEWPDGWQLGTPDLVLTMPEPYALPAQGGDVFRNFVFPVPAAPSRYVRAIEFRADNPKVLHHANVAVDPSRLSRRLDRRDPGPGFAAMPEDQVQNVYGWSPGRVPVLEPPDTGWTLQEGSDLAVQLHMVPSRTRETVRPSIGLYFSKTPPTRTPVVVKLESKAIDIPAGESAYTIEDSYVIPVDVDAVSVYPHAHYLAKEMKGTARLPDGREEPLVWIKQWDIRWQDQYRYETPVFLPKGTTVSMRFTYDNSDRNPNNPSRPARRVRWGATSTDEMGALWLEVIPRRAGDAPRLEADHAERALRADIAGAELQVRSRPNEAPARNYLATKYLQAGRAREAIAELEHALRLRPDDAEAHSNLGSIFQAQGRLADAQQHLREAVRLAPDDDRVRFNLGNVMLAAGRGEDAVAEFQRAVRLNPDNADAHFNLAMVFGPRNRLDEAVAHLRRAVEINPRYADAHRNLAVALGLQGRLDEAIVHARRAMEIQPAEETRQHLERLLAARR